MFNSLKAGSDFSRLLCRQQIPLKTNVGSETLYCILLVLYSAFLNESIVNRLLAKPSKKEQSS